jgi:hypothetical protein
MFFGEKCAVMQEAFNPCGEINIALSETLWALGAAWRAPLNASTK